jgi:hypothetical protein
MRRERSVNVIFVKGADGKPLTHADLPPCDLKRWVSRRKAEVVLAVRGGLITKGDACKRYQLSLEEYGSWERGLVRNGVSGLKAGFARTHRHMGN